MQILNNLLIEILCLLFGGFITWGYTRLIIFIRYREFLRVFGKHSSTDSLTLCLPLWRARKCPREIPRFDKELANGVCESLHGPDDFVAFSDVLGIAALNNLIVNKLKGPLNIALDIDDFDPSKSNLVAIGSPICNFRVRGLIEQMKDDFFQLKTHTETDENPSTILIEDIKNGENFDSSGNREYALIGRVPNQLRSGDYHFFAFGVHATGTTAAVRYLTKNWRKFKKSDSKSAILISMYRGDVASAKACRYYGFN